MSAKFNVVARVNPNNPAGPRRYYPMLRHTGRVTLREFAARIAEVSTVSSIDTVAVLEALLMLLPQELSEGRVVELGDLGTFSLRVEVTGADDPADVTAHHITRSLPHFRPTKFFKDALQATDYERANA